MKSTRMTWQICGMMAIAGAIGTLARYWVGLAAHRCFGQEYPWGTTIINAAGCLWFGFVWMLAENRQLVSGHARLIMLTGFMGAFTTFSTFAFETSQMLNNSQWVRALGYLALQNGLGIAAVFAGYAIARSI